MTARLVFEATLIELSKVQAPALKLYEFNYLFNKAINQYINKVYNTYDLNQQTTDDLRVLKSTAYLKPEKWEKNNSALHNTNANASSYLSSAHPSIQSLHGATYEVALPIDYLHLLNCICIYFVAKLKDCFDAGSFIEVPATRLTADSWSTIITDIYNRPSPMKPYYYIHNQNKLTNNNVLPTDPITNVSSELGMPNGTDIGGLYKVSSNTTDIVSSGASSKLKYSVYSITHPTLDQDKTAKVGNNSLSSSVTVLYLLPNGNFYINLDGGQEQLVSNLTSKYTLTLTLSVYEPVSSEFEVSVDYPDPDLTVAMNGNPGSNFPRTFKLDLDADSNTPGVNVSLVEKPIGLRAGNTSNVRMEIRYGKYLILQFS